jgi:transketolase C-terminal domain/subunit
MEALGRPVVRIGIPDEFLPCGKRDQLLQAYGLTAETIAEKVRTIWSARG